MPEDTETQEPPGMDMSSESEFHPNEAFLAYELRESHPFNVLVAL